MDILWYNKSEAVGIRVVDKVRRGVFSFYHFTDQVCVSGGVGKDMLKKTTKLLNKQWFISIGGGGGSRIRGWNFYDRHKM